MNIIKHLPNFITLLNLFCGCIAMVFVADQQFDIGFYFVCLGIFLDFFDGFFARLFKVSSPLGLQLDSLADMITSGLVPGFVMYKWLPSYIAGIDKNNNISNSVPNYFDNPTKLIPYLGFIITLGACYRLANFNIDSRQTDSFIGLPTPANALFIMSIPLIVINTDSIFVLEILTNPWVLIIITFFSAYIMNAEVPLFSLKMKSFSFNKYKLQIGFLIATVIMILSFQFLAIPLIIITYILLSVFNNKLQKKEIYIE